METRWLESKQQDSGLKASHLSAYIKCEATKKLKGTDFSDTKKQSPTK